MIPQSLTEALFKRAMKEIKKNGVPRERKSVHYDLVVDGFKYPPKYVISIATRLKTGVEHPPIAFNAVEAKNYFLSRGYKIYDRRTGKNRTILPESDQSVFAEGIVRFKQHRYLERDSSISRLAKAKRQESTGCLACEVCEIDFGDFYGQRGDGFIEAHHKTPVSKLDGKSKTRIEDLVLVCSNCHRMLHRGNDLLSVQQLKKLIRLKAGT